MVGRMFQESDSAKKGSGQTMNDRFFNDPSSAAHDEKARKKHYEDMKEEAKANDAQVRHTNVRIGGYSGWKAKKQANKPNLPRATGYGSHAKSSIMDASDLIHNPAEYSAPVSSIAKDAPGLIWSEKDMFKTTK